MHSCRARGFVEQFHIFVSSRIEKKKKRSLRSLKSLKLNIYPMNKLFNISVEHEIKVSIQN